MEQSEMTRQENFQAEKFAAMSQFASRLTHAIGNPLFVISGKTEMLLDQQNLDSDVRSSLDTVNKHIERIREIMNQLFKFCCNVPKELEPVNINDCVKKALAFLGDGKFSLDKIKVIKELDENIPVVKADSKQLQEVFQNLFLNACQAMPEGGGLTIKTSNPKVGFARIQVTDTGCGISEKDLKNIFMPFFSTKKDSRGLGLAISYNTIKNHNGSIEVESLEGSGTTFIIKLPLA